MDDTRKRLDDLMEARRKELRIRWTEVARRAGMSPQNLLRIRKGLIAVSWEAAKGIDYAMEWAAGSVESFVERGEEPRRSTGARPVEPPREAAPVREAALVGLTEDLTEEQFLMFFAAAVKIRRQMDAERGEPLLKSKTGTQST